MNNSVIQLIKKNKLRIKSYGQFNLLVIGLLIIFNIQVKAQTNLQISPSRIVFDGQTKIMELELTNQGQDSAKYSISFIQIRMTDDGKFETITSPDPDQKFSDKNIRFFPRSVRLGPNETQIIKLQLIKGEQLSSGEYRSHLFFKSLIPIKALDAGDIKKDTSAVLFAIVPTFGITVPIIIRVGENTNTNNISDLKIENVTDGTKKLNLTINRYGNMSVYGDIIVTYISSNGKETKIGLSKGVAVYTPNKIHRIKVTLDNKPNVDFSKGVLKVLFTTQSEIRPIKLAEAQLTL